MIFGNIDTTSTYLPLAQSPIWQTAFDTLASLTCDSLLGTEFIRGDHMYINVHTYATKPREQCRFEGHRDMIDVQYVVGGGELVEWSLKTNLTEDGEYTAKTDFQYYTRPSAASLTQVHLTPRHFAIFFPYDCHCPQITDGVNESVLKAVVKIHRSLVS